MNTLELSPDATKEEIITKPERTSRFVGAFRRFGASAGRAGLAVVVGLGLVAAIGVASPMSADAATTRSINAPTSDNSTVTGAADINRQCADPALGCRTYLKVESRALEDPAVPNTVEDLSWKFDGGGWANDDGKNYRTVNLPTDCREYRTVVDTYDYVIGEAGSIGIGVGEGRVSMEVSKSLGSEVHEVHQVFASQPVVHCKMA